MLIGINKTIKSLYRKKQGQAVAEAALVLPLIIFLIMAMLTFGLWIYTKMIVVLAASQSARTGGVWYGKALAGEVTYDEARSKVRVTAQNFITNGLSGTSYSVVITPSPSPPDDPVDVTVKVTYPYRIWLPFMEDIFGGTSEIPITYQATYMVE